ncbi:NAD-dependent protein deacylase [Enterococcus mundtii]|uniref:protein acetyllysine N-acetyltransferase n=1 Tax=Enterococcus mundtii TaxID=53346 RepID=A0A2S7RSX3_ENTMU|nr:NAD-dependent protein deacylase [Enterococcus mundtii]PQF22778.1 NAD-dependent protein deacylase [Enterococcus mundtii]
MLEQTIEEAAAAMIESQKLTFLTGAGVSTPSGIPDYRSLTGVYQGMDRPEYLLSHQAMDEEPQKFYSFLKHLYHPEARPNIIHREIVELAKEKEVWVVSQNIDGLHEKAGSKKLVNFHGNLYHCYCRNCHQAVDWQEYLSSDKHQLCGGQIRPDIVLYGEGFQDEVLEQAAFAVSQADLIVIVGTSFQVHPFCDLIQFRSPQAKLLVINQTPVYLSEAYRFVQTDGTKVFKKIQESVK